MNTSQFNQIQFNEENNQPSNIVIHIKIKLENK